MRSPVTCPGVLLVTAIALVLGCAEGEVTPMDTGQNVRMEADAGHDAEADGSSSADSGSADGGDEDVPVTPPASGPTRAAISSGGGTRASQSYRLDVVVGTPTAASQLASDNFRVGVGVGPYVAPSTSSEPDRTP